MNSPRNTYLTTKILLIGLLIATLVYFFHPGTGQFSVILNGEPVADPLARFTVIPTLLFVLLFIGFLMGMAFLGAGLLIFTAALLFVLFGLFIVAPFFWPVSLIVVLVIVLISLDRHRKE